MFYSLSSQFEINYVLPSYVFAKGRSIWRPRISIILKITGGCATKILYWSLVVFILRNTLHRIYCTVQRIWMAWENSLRYLSLYNSASLSLSEWVCLCVCLFPNFYETANFSKLKFRGMIPVGMEKVLG